jgi:hypothetical protein
VVDLKASGIQIVSSIIGSSLLLFAITTFYSDFFNKPNVTARIVPFTNGTAIELTNNGRVPATNLILTVQSPANISDYEIFTTENRTTMVEDNHTLVAQFPRFVHGDGSFIIIQVSSAEQAPDAFNQNYNIYATYDQGSLRIFGYQIQELISVPYGPTIALTIAALLTFAIPYFYRSAKRNRQRRNNIVISQVAENISYIKEYCKRDLSYFKSSKIHETTAKTIIEIARHINDIKGIFKNERDFYAVSQFYTESARGIIPEGGIMELEVNVDLSDMTLRLQKNRNEIAEIAEKTLGKIRWEEYDVNMTNVMLTVSMTAYDPSVSATYLTRFRRYNIAIDILQPMLAILVIPIVLSIGSYVISGDPLEWIKSFKLDHWVLLAIAVFLGIIIFLSRLIWDLVKVIKLVMALSRVTALH